MINVAYIIVEFYGTMFLAFVVCASLGNPYMVGATLASLIIGTGGVSGAHFNPAVTLACILKNAYLHDNTMLMTFLIYFPIQFVAAIIGALLSWGSLGRTLEID
jgi:aquaporin Z